MTKVLKKDQQNFVKIKLSTNEAWAKKALIAIYNNQTVDEQLSGQTNEFNNIGFTGADAEICTSFAEQLIRKGWLSPKQMTIVFKKMKKYSRQIIEMADEKKLNSQVIKSLA